MYFIQGSTGDLVVSMQPLGTDCVNNQLYIKSTCLFEARWSLIPLISSQRGNWSLLTIRHQSAWVLLTAVPDLCLFEVTAFRGGVRGGFPSLKLLPPIRQTCPSFIYNPAACFQLPSTSSVSLLLPRCALMSFRRLSPPFQTSKDLTAGCGVASTKRENQEPPPSPHNGINK